MKVKSKKTLVEDCAGAKLDPKKLRRKVCGPKVKLGVSHSGFTEETRQHTG